MLLRYPYTIISIIVRHLSLRNNNKRLLCSVTYTLSTSLEIFRKKHVGLHVGKHIHVDRDSVVGIPTRYGLDGPGIESRWGRDFPQPSKLALGPTQPPVQGAPGLSRG
jgi:hypothetical protein